jgi:hypothetical protein
MNSPDPGLPAAEITIIETPSGAPAPAEAPLVQSETATLTPDPEPTTTMEETEAVPEDEKKIETPEVTTPPENPAAALREQIIALVPDEAKSQVAALIRSLMDYAPASPAQELAAPPVAGEEEGAVVRKRYEHLPFRPRITREETATNSEAYGSLAGDPEPE